MRKRVRCNFFQQYPQPQTPSAPAAMTPAWAAPSLPTRRAPTGLRLTALGDESALSYIPEGGWNEPTGYCDSGTYCPDGSGGGPSIYIAKPSWQSGTGVLADGDRDTPDVALPAAEHDGYFGCLDFETGSTAHTCTGGYAFIFGGTFCRSPGDGWYRSPCSIPSLVQRKVISIRSYTASLLPTLPHSTMSRSLLPRSPVARLQRLPCAITARLALRATQQRSPVA